MRQCRLHIPAENHDNRASEPCRGASGWAGETNSGAPIAQCNCADTRRTGFVGDKKREALPERPTDRGPMGGANVTKWADGIVTGRSGLDLVDEGAGADEGA